LTDLNVLGVWARRISKRFGTAYLFLQQLKLATSHLVQNLGLGRRLPRKNTEKLHTVYKPNLAKALKQQQLMCLLIISVKYMR